MMRLVCPNCDAEYEVDEDLVPPEGRDVQCSNCSITWFQKPDQPEADTETAAAAPSLTPQRPDTDPEALAIIHEEVERETRARQSENLETQTDLGLQEAPAPRPKEDAGPGVNEANIAPAPKRKESAKRELFPDIEEINSTLADAPDPKHDDGSEESAPTKASRKSGFRMGFGLMLMLTAALIALYVYAPALTEKFPSMEGLLKSYVALIDKLRILLESGAQGLLAIVSDLTERVGK